MQCLTDNGGGNYSLASPQPTNINDCVFLITQPSELPAGFLNISIEDSLYISGLLALVLVAGFTFRAIARALSTNEGNQNVD